MLFWRDRAGRLSPLKLAAFVAVLAPGTWLAVAFFADALGPKPVTAAIHETGLWSVRWLIAALSVTPLRRIGAWPKLILVRQMLGLAALAYALVHLTLYTLDQAFDWPRIASEIVLRFYLTIGFLTLLGLAALGATSTDAAVRRLGFNWHRLHRAVYALAPLSLLHMALQSKTDVSEAAAWSGIFVLLMACRVVRRSGLADGPLSLAGLALASALATAGLEAAWYAVATGVPALLVLEANLDPSQLRPSDWVLAVGLGLAGLGALRRRASALSGRGRRLGAAAAAA